MDMLAHRKLSTPVDGDDDQFFFDYVPTTVDPGQTLFVIASFICIGSFVCLPLLVKLGTCITSGKDRDEAVNDSEEDEVEDGDEVGGLEEQTGGALRPSQTGADVSFIRRCLDNTGVIYSTMSGNREAHHGENVGRRREAVSLGIEREAQESIRRRQLVPPVTISQVGSSLEVAPSRHLDNTCQLEASGKAKGNNRIAVHLPENSMSSDSTPLCSPGYLRNKIRFLGSIAKYDHETKRIFRLAIPFTVSAIICTVSELVALVIISQKLGTDSVIACIMVDVLVGISSAFMGGWIEAISSVGSMAYGAENYELVGQYVQTACISYVLCEIPFAFIWGATIGDVILLMGFSESVAALAEEYVYLQIAMNMIDGVAEAILDFLEVIEREKFANVVYSVESLTGLGLVALFAFKFDADLFVIGLVSLTNSALFFFLDVFIPSKLGWFEDFEVGLFGQWSFKNSSMVKELFRTALPLAFGSLMAYAEWEMLTFLAVLLGPAEAAAWATVGYVWEVFESTTEAIGDASEVRCAYHLGKGCPAMAKLSAYKSIFIAFVLSLISTGIFLSVSSELPSWLTKDPTIQEMISSCIPLIALGNVTMNAGMICWALVGAQRRYHLATMVALACSIFVTVPLGLIVTLWLKIDLQGLAFAVVIGYTCTANILSTVLLSSNWERLSREIVEITAAEDYSDSEDESSSSSSSADASILFEKPPPSPGTKVPPPPPLPSPPTTSEMRQSQQGSLHRHESPPRTPTKYIEIVRSSPRPMTPNQKQAKCIARLHSLGSEHISSISPCSSFDTPDSHTS